METRNNNRAGTTASTDSNLPMRNGNQIACRLTPAASAGFKSSYEEWKHISYYPETKRPE